jgi:hypothetical protein
MRAADAREASSSFASNVPARRLRNTLRLSKNPSTRLAEGAVVEDDAGIVAIGACIRCRISSRLTTARAS